MFENVPFAILQFLILFNIIAVKELSEGGSKTMLIASIAFTLLQVIGTLVNSFIYSSGMNENYIVYLMTQMSASTNWIPYFDRIAANQLNTCIDFSEILISVPFITHAYGIYIQIDYQFSDQTLFYLLDELFV